MSIANIQEKIKHLPPDIIHNVFVVLIIVTVAVASFALGRFSVEEQGSEVMVQYPDEVLERAQMSLEEEKMVVASSRGTKYYYPWCTGAMSLSPANKIEFANGEEARASGYTPSSSCDGLE